MHSDKKSSAAFDSEAHIYDQYFTYSKIGIAQRNLVWKNFIPIIKNYKIKSVFEINCGTGEDAVFLNKKGISVLPTDVSIKMVEETNSKLSKNGFNANSFCVDINNLDSLSYDDRFDLIFSNFGGLNCLNEIQLKLFFKNSSILFGEKKNYVLVFMGKYCLMEKLYFLFKFRFLEINRRSSNKTRNAKLKYEYIETSFYSIRQIKNILPKNLKIVSYAPIGFFVPPSYLETFFRTQSMTFNLLNKLELMIHNFSFLSNFSDHFIVHITAND
jgi:SAM-dependent methyltransferase